MKKYTVTFEAESLTEACKKVKDAVVAYEWFNPGSIPGHSVGIKGSKIFSYPGKGFRATVTEV